MHAAVDAESVAGVERPPRMSAASTANANDVPHARPVTVYVLAVVDPTSALFR